MIIITPHLFWGNARTTATFPNHKKSHNPHPEGGRGKGAKMGTLHCAWWGGLPNPIIWNPFSCRNKKPTPSNVIGSLMVIRVLPIHVPPCYGGGYLRAYSIETIYDLWWSFGLTHPCSTALWAPDHSTIMRQCKDKGHISYTQEKPQSTSTGGRGGRGSKYMYILGGVGGGLPNLDHIYIYICIYPWFFPKFLESTMDSVRFPFCL